MTTDIAVQETDIAVHETVRLPISVDQAISEWDEYQKLTRRLLDESDYQRIGNRQFKKKSAWRKYARAFNIADRIVYEQIERFEDGFPIWARIRVQAQAPNGRTCEADHECHVKERCCLAAAGLPCDKRTWRGHTCCASGCNGRAHWSHPGDLPATATTRAKNRAISDLIGAGEVSAEEATGSIDPHSGAIEGEIVRGAVTDGPPRTQRGAARPAGSADGLSQFWAAARAEGFAAPSVLVQSQTWYGREPAQLDERERELLLARLIQERPEEERKAKDEKD